MLRERGWQRGAQVVLGQRRLRGGREGDAAFAGFRWRGDRGRHGRWDPVVHAVAVLAAVLPAVLGTASRFLTPWDLLGLVV